VSVGHANERNRPVLKSDGRPVMVEDCHAVIAKRIRYRILVIEVIMVAEDGEGTKRRFETCEDLRDGGGRHAPAAEWLHVDVIAAEQREIGLGACRFIDDRIQPRDIAGMRPSVKVGEERDAKRSDPLRPSGNFQVKMADDMRLSTAESFKPTFFASRVTKRRTYNNACESASKALTRGTLARLLFHEAVPFSNARGHHTP
jgi:hypothetical protein